MAQATPSFCEQELDVLARTAEGRSTMGTSTQGTPAPRTVEPRIETARRRFDVGKIADLIFRPFAIGVFGMIIEYSSSPDD